MAAERPDISICVAVWKDRPEPNLGTLHAALDEALDGLRAELVIVLNGLPPESALVPRDAEVIHLVRNRGIPVAWNQAAGRARANVLCFANDDVVPGPRSLRMLHDALQAQPEVGVVGVEGNRFDFCRRRAIDQIQTDDLDPGGLRDCDYLTGCLLVTPREVFRRAGGFDESYTPCWFEDVDYCITVQRVLGMRCCVVAGAPYRHSEGISSARIWQRIRYDGTSRSVYSVGTRNSRYFAAKWGRAATR